jgi:hypothetical protein
MWWKRKQLLASAVGITVVVTIVGAAFAFSHGTVHAASASFSGGTATIQRQGTVNFTAIAQANAKRPKAAAAAVGGPHQKAPLGLVHPRANTASAQQAVAAGLAASASAQFGGNVSGEKGFDGITAAINGAANSPEVGGVGDVSPPDQGLAVGPGPSPNPIVIVEAVNDTFNFYAPNGNTILGALGAYQVFALPASAFLSDPRAYWDPQTGHWFFTMFTFAPGDEFQYIAVSQTTDPFGSYTVFSIPTDDSSTSGCPCFGDFDQIGSDHSGIYIATNEFGVFSGAFNGTIIYAVSKEGLIDAANGSPLPVLQMYRVLYASDPFAAYHLSPSTVTQGSSNPNTEYFVESDANLISDSALEVYALLGTSVLNTGGRPTMVMTLVNTEGYISPPNVNQENGPLPLGSSLGYGVAQLQTDFDAVQEVTYANGLLYAELDTAFPYGTGQNSGAAWFVLKPKTTSSSVSVTNEGNGLVKTSQNLLYPVIGVNASGKGFMAFAVAGNTRYPSAGYVTFNGTKGAGKTVYIAANGVAPLDDFTCYPFGACRYGDYSMAQVFNGKVYMATEYIAPQPRDYYANWDTRVFYAPA